MAGQKDRARERAGIKSQLYESILSLVLAVSCYLVCFGIMSAQEESLARSSTLYAAVVGHRMYNENRAAIPTHKSIYLDQILYSPSVMFLRDEDGRALSTEETWSAGVVTAPAPNRGAATKHYKEPELSEKVRAALTTRARLSLSAFAAHGHNIIILGKWGTGVFKCQEEEVAEVFNSLLREEFKGVFEHVVYAVMGNAEKPGKFERCIETS
ncbi:conserved hypothetical protein CHP02452 [Kipferlia bialata]|uniref:Microbial-type PARG catalytic domain-containing protein n=1 Tax=Kipferlia bialata TaxID=797122 RepID=A0A9K3D2A4_9EUKA|nr:conserved hypothetical protein CHP02452 [Kipferlia bialata]|eukprot:g7784.t1